METLIKNIACKAYRTYLRTEDFFLADSFELSIDQSTMKSEIKKSITTMRDSFIDFYLNDQLHTFIMKYIDNCNEDKKETFFTDLFNLTVLSTYLTIKYKKLSKLRSLDRQQLIDNLAITFTENCYLGNNRNSFHPYHITNIPRSKNPIQNLDFYALQTGYLQHILLILVVSCERWKILPNIEFRKIGQKNLVSSHTKTIHKQTINTMNKLTIYDNSLLNTIKNFQSILQKAKQEIKKNQRILIHNVFFSKQAINMLDYDKLIKDNYYIFEEKYNHATETQIRETIALAFEKIIKNFTGREERVWRDVHIFMEILNIPISKRKNKKMNFFNEELIGIKNENGDIFFIKPLITEKSFRKTNAHRRLNSLFWKNTKDQNKFITAYTFD